jgi:glutathione S-transferase
MIKLYGSSGSPFVRKVQLTLEYKELPYEQIPIGPGMSPPNWLEISPLGKMPALEHDGFRVPDSSVICRYLDDVFPARPIYPGDVRTRATACWHEEYGDSRLVETVTPFFFERVIKPVFFKQPTDETRLVALEHDNVPAVLNYLDGIAPTSGFLVGEVLTIADFAIVSPFLTGKMGGFSPDAKYRKLNAYLDRVRATPVFAKRLEKEAAEFAALRR